jgi:hypothetical protein
VTKQFVMEEKQDPRPIQGYYEWGNKFII